MKTEFTLNQKRALAVFTLIALLFGAYFLRDYFVLIVVAAVGTYLFTPVFNWFNKRLGTGLSATCTLLSALVMVIVPIGLLLVLAFVQISRMVDSIAGWVKTTDLSVLGDKVLHVLNDLAARVPFAHITITAETLRKAIVTAGHNAGEWLLHFFFFFQAEDGIRDLTVTGVQTCALPISLDVARRQDASAIGMGSFPRG